MDRLSPIMQITEPHHRLIDDAGLCMFEFVSSKDSKEQTRTIFFEKDEDGAIREINELEDRK